MSDKTPTTLVSSNKRKSPVTDSMAVSEHTGVTTPDSSSNSLTEHSENDAEGQLVKKPRKSSFCRLAGGPNPLTASPSLSPLPIMTDEERLEKMKGACETILQCIGEEPTREGLIKTPKRWAEALLFMTKGYTQTIEEVTNNAVFEEGLGGANDMVVVRDIDIHSLCEHHMVPFTGKVHVGYIPRRKVLGISKIARIAEVFARRLQVQERLTREIGNAIMDAVDPLGVAVVVECSHMCMVMRGVCKVGSNTATSCVLGCFQTDQKTRSEFFSIINGGSFRR